MTEYLSARRRWLKGVGGLVAFSLLPRPLVATPAQMKEAMRTALGNGTVRPGRVNLELPPLAENGNSVRLSVAVDSPMTDDDHVTFIQVFSERNPLPDVVRFELGPWNGRAAIETRIRIAGEQSIVAVAGMSNGTFWSGSAAIVVTEAACLDALI